MDEIARARSAKAEATEHTMSVPLCASDDGEYSASYVTSQVGTFHQLQELDVIVYLLSGLMRVTADNGHVQLDVAPGDAIFLPRGSAATWEVHAAAHKLVVYRMPAQLRTASG